MSAIISPCGRYRYRLERGTPKAPALAWIMCNPSTADALLDDQTIKKIKHFTFLKGFDRFIVGNVCALRARSPDAIRYGDYDRAIGPDNREHLAQIASDAEQFVLAWGTALPKRFHPAARIIVETILRPTLKPIICLGYTDSGDPRHPVMISYSTPFEEFRWKR